MIQFTLACLGIGTLSIGVIAAIGSMIYRIPTRSGASSTPHDSTSNEE